MLIFIRLGMEGYLVGVESHARRLVGWEGILGTVVGFLLCE